MFCRKCGKNLNPGEMFCANCGTKVEIQNTQVGQIIDNNVGNNQSQTILDNSVYQNQGVQQNININQSNAVSKPQMTNINMNQQQINPIQQPNQVVTNNNVNNLNNKKKNNKLWLIILISSIGFVLLVIIVIALLSRIKQNNDVNTDTNISSDNVYFGDGYELSYDYNWSIVTLSGGQEGLQYKLENSYFVPIGTSSLTQYTNYLECDFDTSSCQQELYDYFYSNWYSELLDSSLYLYKDDTVFNVLNNDIYYATFDYGKSSNDLRGKYYLLVTKEKDVILSFMSNSEARNVDNINNKVVEMLKNIEIDYNSTIVDDELYDVLTSMSNWNMYSDLRQGNLGKISYITGGWRKLEESEEYWVFRDGHFWWYQSVNNLNDNYWYGTMQVVTGKEGLALVGLDESKVDTIFSNSNGNVTGDDIYTIVLTPTQIISGGVDKSSTNIPEGTTWTYVWILVDHGSEGIEAQVLNMQTYNTSYFVKLED